MISDEATGGTLKHVLGKDANTTFADGWKTSIPIGTDVGIYYVWYKPKEEA